VSLSACFKITYIYFVSHSLWFNWGSSTQLNQSKPFPVPSRVSLNNLFLSCLTSTQPIRPPSHTAVHRLTPHHLHNLRADQYNYTSKSNKYFFLSFFFIFLFINSNPSLLSLLLTTCTGN
jgi:hypothetical protein